MIIMDSVIPRPPAPPPLPPPFGPLSKLKKNPSTRSKASTCTSHHNGLVNGSGFITGNGPGSGFRLMDDQGDTGSVYSAYKQRIDSMFESDSSQGTNSVQAKIEKMFSDVAKDSGVPIAGGVHSFSVDYLGSVPLHEKVTSLSGLQSPLRDLYFAYKKTHKKTLTGRLEISGQGLKVQYQGDKGDLEQLNSFPTIAVWSAVKFVIREGARPTYAFLPLITDPDNIDKKMLFRALEEQEKKYINSQAHSPLFAVVMRKIGVHKQLECHGFVCQTSEDAIVIAATLYKSLMAHMKQKEKKPKSRNGITCMSITSSVFNEKTNSITPVRPPRKKRSTTSSIISESDAMNISDTQPLLCKKQPRKSTKTRRAPKAPDDFDAILPYEEPIQPPGLKAPPPPPKPPEIKPKTFSDKINTFMSKEQKQITAEIKHVLSEGTNRGLKSIIGANHSSSAMSSMESQADDQVRKDNTGDILTKVTIPRSGSFLNAGGLTRYKSKVSRSNGQATGGSPLGFNELFNEFRLQEGLHSMDEILGVIIDPEGMSFNDLKPIYKEFLLKLSVTLTKDELYQRSKMIMRRQKKKQMRRNNTNNNNNQSSKIQPNHHRLVGSKFKRLKHIFQKKLRLGKANKTPPATQESQKETNKLPESSISTSSYDTRQFTPKNEAPVASKKQSYKKRRDRTSTSEESDFFSIRRKANKIVSQNQNRNSSSGYVSCSECSYDSDTCTCISADKCYCSLGNSKGVKDQLTYCGCDTDSCTESNKCYCLTATKNHTILEQLKRRGFMPELHHGHTTKHKKLCKRNSNTKSTRSLEYMHNPMEAYYEKLGVPKAPRSMQGGLGAGGGSRRRSCNSDNMALDYELFSIQNVRNRAVYATALGETMHHSRQASMRSYTSSRYGIKDGRTVQQSISAGACTEALSVKKSAEIAALFADIKLSQTTDIAHLGHRNVDMISSRNAYNKLITQNAYGPLRNNNNGREAAIYGGQKMVQNALYGGSGRNAAGAKMYSAKNGLYTIQSQSDESRRSSVSDEKRGRDSGGGGGGGGRDRDYFDIDGQFQNNKSSLENSLGYLP